MDGVQNNESVSALLAAAAQVAAAQQTIILQLQQEVARAQSQLEAARTTIAELQAENRDLVYDLLMQQERDDEERAPEYPDIIAMRRQVAQRLRSSGVSLRTIGNAFGVNEKSIRNWTVEPMKEAA